MREARARAVASSEGPPGPPRSHPRSHTRSQTTHQRTGSLEDRLGGPADPAPGSGGAAGGAAPGGPSPPNAGMTALDLQGAGTAAPPGEEAGAERVERERERSPMYRRPEEEGEEEDGAGGSGAGEPRPPDAPGAAAAGPGKRAGAKQAPVGYRVERGKIPAPARNYYPDLQPKPQAIHGDDEEGHLIYRLGENITDRYKILSNLGEGTFGKVVECWDRIKRKYVAMKIIRNVQKYRDAAMIELEVLSTLRTFDKDGRWHCVRFHEWFDYRNHICMTFDKLGPSLYDFLRRNNYRPFDLSFVQAFSKQLLEAVEFLHRQRLCHTDLKPENILLKSSQYTKEDPPPGSRRGRRVPSLKNIVLIDFGSATFEDDYHSSIVSTRHYRAPEVILGLGWSYPCDIWSVGGIIFELITGEALFQTHENREHLAMMERVLGPIPADLSRRATKGATKYFTRRSPYRGERGVGERPPAAAGEDREPTRSPSVQDGPLKLNWPEPGTTGESVSAVKRLGPLKDLMGGLCDSSVTDELERLADLITLMLQYDPETRITAEEALKHDFFAAPRA